MKKLFIILILLIVAAGCGIEDSRELPNKESLEVDSLIITHIDNGDTITFKKSTIDKFKSYFEFDKKHIPPPDELIKMAEDDDEMSLMYGSEAGVDNFYQLYSYSLHTEKSLEKYILQRDDLLELYRCINGIHGTLDYGGTFYGHQYARAIGIAEYWMYQKSLGEVTEYDFFLIEHAKPFLDSLQLHIDSKIDADENIFNKEEELERKQELSYYMNQIDTLIHSYFHIDQIREYQKKYYVYQ